MKCQAVIKIPRRNISNLRYAGNTTLMAESREELNSLLMKLKEESEKDGLKLSIQKTKIMASCPIHFMANREIMRDFILRGFKILQMVTAALKLKDFFSLEEKL